MSPSYNVCHLSPHCHLVYLSILLLYFPVPPSSVPTSLLSLTVAVALAGPASPPFHALASAGECPTPQLKALGIPRAPPFFLEDSREQQECASGEGPFSQTPSLHAVSALWTAPGIALTASQPPLSPFLTPTPSGF